MPASCSLYSTRELYNGASPFDYVAQSSFNPPQCDAATGKWYTNTSSEQYESVGCALCDKAFEEIPLPPGKTDGELSSSKSGYIKDHLAATVVFCQAKCTYVQTLFATVPSNSSMVQVLLVISS